MKQNKRIKRAESACTNRKTCYNTPMTEQQESSNGERALLEAILENPSSYSNEEVGQLLLELEKLKWEHSLTR